MNATRNTTQIHARREKKFFWVFTSIYVFL